LAEAHAVLRSLLDTEQVDPAATRQLSRVLAMAGDDKAASGVLDDGLRQVPADADLLSARIRLAAECGEDPQPFLQRVPQGAMTPEGLAMLRVDVSLAAGDLAEARATLEEGLARNPLWLDGHRQLAQLLAQVEQPEAIGRHFADLLTKHPSAEPLHRLRVQMLQATERWEESLAAIVSARERCSDPLLHEELDQLEAVAFDEAGHRDRAAAAFARTGSPNTNFRLAHVRHLLRRGDWDGAARKAEAVAGETNHGAAWAYLASAWRLTGDTRAQWLAGDDAFVRTFDLDQAFSMLDELADRLRGLHKGHAHPIGQSLRSGTQTHGNLFTLRDPLIRRLRDMFAAAVSDYAAGLPPFDPKHPLLSKPREQRTFTGSWSVRLTDGGHHVSHIHPEGWISSAFYVTLPSGEATAGEQAGWLHLGKPPEELGLDLPPLRVVEPKRGRLAIFPSYLWHGTNKFGAGERMSVAFDMVPLIDDRL
jgi:tetratricopeptide (TPR) repeat protein